ncbi:arabinose 5-phosphate isomerase [Echria macrotheca]|uniref:Arabinose 5-phosphate isomerase n=1 Tax=Echria macrotheca TaxID=438768 RepID=A0AAJ0BEJ8_9PEZI|nr:arabinose 5-phosphate isomerase [Echria macrotheca]
MARREIAMGAPTQQPQPQPQPQPQRPVHNSEVYLVRNTQFAAVPPPSPPSPITPAESDFCPAIEALDLTDSAIPLADARRTFEQRLAGAVHVLNTETTALQCLTRLYSADPVARDGFSRAVEAIARRQGDQGNNGKVVVIGVGKSGHIAKKLVATFNSLAIQAVFLHPTEALHGDLGQIDNRRDTLLLITFSGKTPELLALLPHLDKSLPLILLTSHTRPQTCEIVRHRPDTILLPAPIHEAETISFGVSAPTTSTTVALTVGDALAIVASQELHPSVASVFARNHPGGAIGAALRRPPREEEMRHLAVPLDAIADLLVDHDAARSSVTGADILRAGYASPSGWVRLPDDHGSVISPRRIRRLESADLVRDVKELRWLAASRADFVSIAADTTVRDAAEWIRAMLEASRPGCAGGGGRGEDDEAGCSEDSIIAVVGKQGECIGLLEVARLLDES